MSLTTCQYIQAFILLNVQCLYSQGMFRLYEPPLWINYLNLKNVVMLRCAVNISTAVLRYDIPVVYKLQCRKE